MSEIFHTEISAARELCGGSTYRLRKYFREAGLLDDPINVNGRLLFTAEQIRTARNRAARLAYQPTTTIKPIRLDEGERLA